MPASWAIGPDLWKFLIGAGLHSANPTAAQKMLDLDGACLGAKQDFERATKWEPFLVSGSSTISYSPADILFPPNELPMLDLDGGFTAVTAVKMGITPDDATGTTLTVNRDYFLRPTRAASKGKPYTWIEFYRMPPFTGVAGYSNYPDSIRITGSRGYSTTIPDLAFNAVLHRAAQRVAPQVAASISNGLLEWKDADVSEKYGANPLQAYGDAWSDEWKSAVRSFARLVVK